MGALGNWVTKQRSDYRLGTLRKDRKAVLEALGFEWTLIRRRRPPNNSKNDEKWLQQYRKLEEFKALYDHTNVPKSWEEDPKLGKWVQWQRTSYRRHRQNTLRKDRIELLERLGFQWEIQQENWDRLWMESYNNLLEFQDKHGHLQVPDKKVNGWSILYDWCGFQRQRQS